MRKFRTGPESDFVEPSSKGNGNGAPSPEHLGNGHGTPSVEHSGNGNGAPSPEQHYADGNGGPSVEQSGNGYEVPQSGEANLGRVALNLSPANARSLAGVLEVVARRGSPDEIAFVSPEAQRILDIAIESMPELEQ